MGGSGLGFPQAPQGVEGMRIFRIISGITLISGSGWIGPFVAKVLEVEGFDAYAVAIVAAIGGMLVYSGCPFVGKKTVKVGRF